MADVVGVAVEGRVIRGVEVHVGRNGRHEVRRTGETPIPESIFDDGRLRDPEGFSEHLRRLWTDAGFKSKRVRLVIDGRLAVVRRTELPSGNPDKLRQAAGYDIGELLAFPIQDAVFDVDEIEQFEREGVTWARALVVAVSASDLAELKLAVASAGLRLSATDLAAEALARSVSHDATPQDGESVDDAPMAIVDCEDSVTNVVIRDASGVLFARTLNIGVGETAISVADELESALAQLSGTDNDQTGRVGDTDVGISNVVEGIRRTLGYYTTELDQRPIRRVAVVGGRRQATGLVASLENTLALPVGVVPSTATWPPELDSAGFELPLGAALGSAPSKARHLVLTSDRERAARTKRRQRASAVAVTLPVAGLLLFATAGLRSGSVDARSDTEQAEAAASALALKVSELEEASSRRAGWEAAAADVRRLEDQQLRLQMVVRELAEAMPEDARLVSIQLTAAAGDDAPIGYTGPSPAGLVSITGVAGDLDGVARWLSEANGTQTIEGLWLDQSTFGPIGADGTLGAIFSVKGAITSAARPIDSLVTADTTLSDDSDELGVTE